MGDENCTTEGPPVTRNTRKGRWMWWLVVAVAVIVFLSLASPHIIWDGMAQRTIHVRVTDNSMEYPVSGATVTLMQARDYAIIEHLDQAAVAEMLQQSHHLATTNERGEAIVVGQFGSGGESGLFGSGGAFLAEGVLVISHPKYHTAEGMLQNYLQRKKFSTRTKKLDVHIFLAPK
jgi:hypothetical protein